MTFNVLDNNLPFVINIFLQIFNSIFYILSQTHEHFQHNRPARLLAMSRRILLFARHGRALTGASPEHAQIVGSV